MSTQLRVLIAPAVNKGHEEVVLGTFERSVEGLSRLSAQAHTNVLHLTRGRSWTGIRGQVGRVSDPSSPRRSVVVYGLGSREEFDCRRLSNWLRQVFRNEMQGIFRRVAVILPSHESLEGSKCALRTLTELSLANYLYEDYKSKGSEKRSIAMTLIPPEDSLSSFRKAGKLVPALVEGIRWSRDLANTPPNIATPEWLAEQARRMAKARQMKIRILGPAQLERMKMGGMLAVGRGSSNPPRLVRLEWGRGEQVIAFVGKGVTFDTGGISIKPSRSMDEMKYDKCGACAVLGVAKATSAMNLPFRFRAYLPLAENMPDGSAYRPGDIIRSYNGKTIEITNTDAEGRIILADALAWAAREQPDQLLELSTLTGATVVALGHHAAALYTPSQELAEELLVAAQESGEKLWRMPLWEEFGNDMKGVHADLRNAGGRWGGANGAAAFLSNFVGDVGRWAHLDVAGTAYRSHDTKDDPGATGFGVALIIHWLLRQAGKT